MQSLLNCFFELSLPIKQIKISLGGGYQPRTNRLKDEKCDLVANSHIIFSKVEGPILSAIVYCSFLFNVHEVNGWTCRKCEGVVGTGWSRLRIGTGGGHL